MVAISLMSKTNRRLPALRIVVVTTFFPNAADPHRTPFVKNLVKAMMTGVELEVLAPVAIAPAWLSGRRWARLHDVPERELFDDIEVQHPKFLVLPKMSWFSGVGYFLGIWRYLSDRKRRGKPFLVHTHCGYPDSVGVAIACRLLKLPYVVTLHGSDINVYAEKTLLRPQIRWALAHASGVVAVSSTLEAKVKTMMQSTVKRTAYIPCAGFDPALFFVRDQGSARESLEIEPRRRVVVYVGNVVSIKGVDVLIKAWATRKAGQENFDDLLVIVGAGERRPALEAEAANLGLGGSIQFRGALPQSDVSRWIAAADVLCLPSRNEGMPNVVVEALATGVPVVACRVGGIPELVEDGVNGLLVEVDRPNDLADAIERALHRVWLRDEIRRSVENLTWAKLAARNLEFFRSLPAIPESDVEPNGKH